MRYIILFLSLVLIFSNCIKPDVATVYVSGYYYDSCNGQPIKNQALSIFQFDANSNNGGIIGNGSTDSTGYFKINYSGHPGNNVIELRVANTVYGLISLPSQKLNSLDNIDVYSNSKCNIVVKLNVINPYTNADTLQITNFNPPYTVLKIPGPFTNGILYTANNFQILLPGYIDPGQSGNSRQEIRYSVNYSGTILVKEFKMISCATNEVTIDIQ